MIRILELITLVPPHPLLCSRDRKVVAHTTALPSTPALCWGGAGHWSPIITTMLGPQRTTTISTTT